MDWSAAVAVILGAFVALGGVLISQRAERRRAHADRIWIERSATYVLLYRWASTCTAFVDEVDSRRVWASEHLLDLDVKPAELTCRPLDPLQRAQMAIYSSRSVRTACENLDDSVSRMNVRLKTSYRSPIEPELSTAVHAAADGLQAVITRELGGVDERPVSS